MIGQDEEFSEEDAGGNNKVPETIALLFVTAVMLLLFIRILFF